MSEERKDRDIPRFGSSGLESAEPKANLASRARNRTVLLTPDAIGQVRANALADTGTGNDPVNEVLPPVSWDYQQGGGSSAATDSGFVGVGKALEEVTRREGPKRSTGKFQTAGLGAASSSMTSAMISPASDPKGFGPVRNGSGSATQQRPSLAPLAPRREPPKSKIVGFLIGFDAEKNGEVSEIRAGRWLVTSKPTDHGDFVLIDDESISPLHAIIRATTEGKVQVLDQLSEFGTGVFRAGSETEEEVAGTMANVSHGDTIRFGKRHFVVCMVPIGITPTIKKEEES